MCLTVSWGDARDFMNPHPGSCNNCCAYAIGPWLVVTTVVALAGYLLYTLQMISPEYETKPSSARFAYYTWMALQHVLASFSAKVSLRGTAKYRLFACTQHSTIRAAGAQ